ncbi:natural cytotoxicity triggering receptor 3 ligand 1-like [Mauremys mutica]|uniref:natural cytotoxicity triggering receptor 3 ligand 1-like n=1 Tax=Mauremys mutica TaxID=74926 RepID=UPI001D167593|nr:natural cytotoxicity triggering receptor 3 ligand 1-like [Mauremys mutica]
MATLWGRRAGAMGLGGLLLPLLVLGVAGSRLQLVTDPSSRALLGSGTLVKCRFDVGGPVDLSALRVQWYLWEERIAQYDQGRVESQVRGSLSEQELENGNASLWLSSVTVSDMGLYKCVVGYGTEQLQGETTLHVLAAPRLSVPRKAGVLNAATSFPCHVWGFYPGDVTVTWLRDGQVLTDATRSAPQRNPDGTFNLTLTYTFTPTLSDSGIIFSCHVSHAALAQPLREEFPLAVTGADHTSAAIGATLGILVAGGAAAAIAIYCWRKRREGRGAPYSVSEVLGPARCLLGQEVTLSCSMEGTFPKDTAVTWERIHGQDRTVIGTDGLSEAGERPEHQPLLHPQPQRWRATQERSPCKDRSGTCLAASLSFTPRVQDDGVRVRCSFHHKSRGIREQRESGEIRLWAEPG